MGSTMASNGPHAAGIFADMTVDGPEIGTLVLIVDRAKNLPNLKTMGKQNPYCAARLGKEARKTETDQRGGQTPRWDQEIRFTVHDSPDYYNLKISVFSEDKRTDLIGEAWVRLDDIVVPGGGKGDLWQGLTCKGKYAGEIRVELTYYDQREKLEEDNMQGQLSIAEELKQQYGTLHPKVKRRPLPNNPNAPATKEVVIPERPLPGRAKHGPRDFSTPPTSRASPHAAKTYNYPASASTLFGQTPVGATSSNDSQSPNPEYEAPHSQYYGEYTQEIDSQVYDPRPAPAQLQQPDFLPQLGPSRAQRGSVPPQPRHAQSQQMYTPPQSRPMSHIGIPHSHSAPVVPTTHDTELRSYDDSYQLRADYPEPIPDVDYQYQQVQRRRSDAPPDWHDSFAGAYTNDQSYLDTEPQDPPPPQPPMHTHSSPVVPHYNSPHSEPYLPANPRYRATPPSSRQQYLPRSSPLQSIERYAQHTPPNREPPRRGQSMDEYGDLPYHSTHQSSPELALPGGTSPSPYSRPSSYGRPAPGRNSIADPYNTPSRQPHPLSQEIPRARSPNPYRPKLGPDSTPENQPSQQSDHRRRDTAPLIKPRAMSPQPPHVQSPAIRNPYSIQFPVRAFESSDNSPLSTSRQDRIRAKVVPGPEAPIRKSVSPRPSTSEGTSPAVPFSPDSFDVHNPTAPGSEGKLAPRGPIVGWHGQEIDPSDHLPVESWAPEPEEKKPVKTYGMGRDRDFGPRNISKDTVVNFRMKQSPQAAPEPQPQQPTRNKLFKKSPTKSPVQQPLRDHDNFNPVPNPYEQTQFSRDFKEGSPGGYGPPNIPPKVPFESTPDALSREISSIDIGTSSGRMSRGSQSPAAYVPVRSHRDRNSFY